VLKQKAEESDRLKSAFLANISHEIRTPLNAIMGFVNIMSNYKLSKKEYESYANIINEEGDVLLNLINDLIDISAIESGQLKIKKEPVHLRKLMHNLYNIGEQQLHQKDKEHIQLKYTCDEKLDESILTDVTRLNQVLKNLIQNAIKYTNEGKIEFGYQYVNGYVQFFVKDTGIGIPESKKEYVFERFTQIENADNPPEGTGLGLAISKSLTELLGGTIDFDSSQYGTVFYLTVPMS
jgi:signal transduction histidine kinase